MRRGKRTSTLAVLVRFFIKVHDSLRRPGAFAAGA